MDDPAEVSPEQEAYNEGRAEGRAQGVADERARILATLEAEQTRLKREPSTYTAYQPSLAAMHAEGLEVAINIIESMLEQAAEVEASKGSPDADS